MGIVSNKQLEANRQNAQKSTGPRTEGGKARSSRNALIHALTASKVVINGEDAEALNDLIGTLVEEHAPEGTTEILLVREMAMASWRLRRTDQLEAQVFESTSAVLMLQDADLKILNAESISAEARFRNLEPDTEAIRRIKRVRETRAELVSKTAGNPATVFKRLTSDHNFTDALLRYRAHAERSFYRALDKLKELQLRRRANGRPAGPLIDHKPEETSIASTT